MCDVCSDVLDILSNFEYRSQNGGFHMDKKEILSFVLYVCLWPQRQCMCCFKDYRNFEKLNSMVQDSLSVGIRLIQTLPGDSEKEILQQGEENKENTAESAKPTEELQVTVETAERSEVTVEGGGGAMEVGGDEGWSMEEKDKLLQFVTKVFLMNFPSYIAYKHIVHSSLEELSQQETSALNNYCEISLCIDRNASQKLMSQDPDVPLFLLRNVCFFCDTNGIGALTPVL